MPKWVEIRFLQLSGVQQLIMTVGPAVLRFQTAALRPWLSKALENSGVSPGKVSIFEAHGTGTALGDPIEVFALQDVFSESHSSENPLYLGSVKTNIGHLEAAAE
jgi:acyl transferase domain-containing protein